MTHLVRTAAVAAFVVMSAALARAEVIQTKSGGLDVTTLVKLDSPWAMAFLPDGRLLITEKPGRLRVYSGDGKLSDPIAGVPKVDYRGQGGLLDVKIDPDFAKNGLVYLSYAEPADEQPPGAKDEREPRLGPNQKMVDTVLKGGAVARGKLDGAQLRDVTVIWRQTPKTIGRGHYGGHLAFAPDGKLFITSGERQRFEPAQDTATNLGKIVRINPDGSIPADNPFVNTPGVRPDVWTIGQRNPLGIAFHPVSHHLWIDEMGPKGGDEFNLVERGKNYGWPIVSEGNHYNDAPIPKHSTRPDFTPPAHAWNPVISPSGLIFYTGERFPAWRGNALIGGLSSKALIRLTLDADERVTGEERIAINHRVRDVVQAPDGAVMLLYDAADGALVRLTPEGKWAGQ